MGFSRQEYWSGLPSPSPGDLPDPGIEPRSPELQADCLPTEGIKFLKKMYDIKNIYNMYYLHIVYDYITMLVALLNFSKE